MVRQPEGNPKLLLTGLNPAHRTLGFYLDNQLNSKFYETLGHENTLDIVSNQGPKVLKGLTFEAIPAGQVGESTGEPPECIHT